MSNYTYTYSIATDFHGNLNDSQLYSEIVNDPLIVTSLVGIETDGDAVYIIFASQLSVAEFAELTVLIVNYVTISPQGYYILPFDIKSATPITSTSFVTVATAVFAPNLVSLTNFKVVSYMTSGGTNYTVQVYDVLNSLVLASATLSNTSVTVSDLGTVSNLPAAETILQLQIQVASGTTVNIDSATLYYN